MKLVLASGRATRTPWADEAVADYGRRIRRWFPFEEGELVLKTFPERARLVLLDERGQDLTSEQWAGLLEAAIGDGAVRLVFAIGGPYGHEDAARARAWKVVRLGSAVMNHAVARVVVAEQIYRACSIRAGTPYHHGG